MMEKNMMLVNHTRKVNKILAISMWVVIGLILLGTVFGNEVVAINVAVLVIGIVAATIMIKMKRFETLIGNILCYTYFLYIILDIVLSNYNLENFLAAIVINICFITLYMNKRFLIIFGIIFNTVSVILCVLMQEKRPDTFTNDIIVINLCMILLYFAAKWGSELIVKAYQKEKESMDTVEELKNVVTIIKDNSTALKESISNCNENLLFIKEGSGGIIATMQDVTKGIVEQAGSITDISNMISNADAEIGEIVENTKKMSQVSAQTSEVVKEGAKNIDDMDRQMNIINSAITQSLSTVTELEQSMDEINNFLGAISQIAEQTNLLALNAAIEAARAGEQGRGFAVVADEVRKLAEKSSETVGLIGTIVNNIREKTSSALKTVKDGTEAVHQGATIVSKVNNSFDSIEASFKNIDSSIEEELKVANNTSLIFKKVQEQSESIASIAEEHSASTEEMLAIVSEQDNSIVNISDLVKYIQASSNKLDKLVEENTK